MFQYVPETFPSGSMEMSMDMALLPLCPMPWSFPGAYAAPGAGMESGTAVRGSSRMTSGRGSSASVRSLSLRTFSLRLPSS